ncbi:MAG: hypothetical protein JWQ87_3863 [Candidatus Sulfotelmatobacter sp.]|nr:hypothetical protein [Candidatus Sulfotelmatobacter sp.]
MEGLAEFYLGTAQLEALTLSNEKSMQIPDSEVDKAKSALSHFSNSRDKIKFVLGKCTAAKQLGNLQKPNDLVKRLEKITANLEKNTLPNITDVHGALALMNGLVTSGTQRASAHRGKPGHMPAEKPGK